MKALTLLSGGFRWKRFYKKTDASLVGYRNLSSTTPKYQVVGGNNILTVKSCKDLSVGLSPQFIGVPHSKLTQIVWDKPLHNIYLVKKPWNPAVRNAAVEFIIHILKNYPSINIIMTEDFADELLHETSTAGIVRSLFNEIASDSSNGPSFEIYTGTSEEIIKKTELIVTLGGDGTILRAASLFSNARVPPILSFALGTLGFLLPFDFSTYKETFERVYTSQSKALHRGRLECHVSRRSAFKANSSITSSPLDNLQKLELASEGQIQEPLMVNAMNDVALHRGGQPNLTSLDIYIDNEHLTTTTADGIVFSTPTGSTAYSLSSGGPIVHPLVPCIILTPICPRSLSFRPLVLPSTSHIMVKFSSKNRNSTIKLTIDGIPQGDLEPGDQIHIVNENGTIYIPGKYDNPSIYSKKQEFNNVIDPGYRFRSISARPKALPNYTGPSQVRSDFKGIWCIARSENDWTKDINELLGFNSSFKASKGNT